MNFRIAGLIAGTSVAAVGLGLLAATPAHAATANRAVPVAVTSYGSSHTSPSPTATKIRDFQPRDTPEVFCYVKGQKVNGSDTWLRLSNMGGGYISRTIVDSAPAVPACW